ncbi:hypothetical protein THRCLA_01149 [Thraustotheca clavata]|uniref:Secreted protein n=1 Tax=Thraustotheca clavata TaxID=74557 RepID=A0A0A7CLA6_9STRA|nr:secreted protein [Thraustotheca clavata]OQS06829.1 hypothetical protein THRCLA_01149 [Thraustotheca clavata]
MFALIMSALLALTSGFEIPTQHILTSTPELCGDICPLQDNVPAQACVYYPHSLTDYNCTQSSLGSCIKTNDSDVKCLNNNWAQNSSYSIGIRGTIGSFGRSEPVRVIQNYAAANITELILKNYNDEKYYLTLLDGAFTNSSLTSLWIENVNLSLQEKVFPPQLRSLVLRKADLRWIPKEIFTLCSLEKLDLSGQTLDTTQLTEDEKAFLNKLNFTSS